RSPTRRSGGCATGASHRADGLGGGRAGWRSPSHRLVRVHGEYKVPGGKLVVVDLEVVDDTLKDVVVSGDFFLEPDDALAVVSTALHRLTSHSTTAQMR